MSSSSYSTYDFSNNVDFQEFLGKFYPPLEGSQLEKKKQRWYKDKVDPQFEMSTTFDTSKDKKQSYQQPQPTYQQPPQQQASQEQQQPPPRENSQQQRNQQHGQSNPPSQLPVLYMLEGCFKVMYFPCLGFIIIPGYSLYVNFLTIIVCLLAIFRMVGRPQFNQQYLVRLMPNEFVGNLLYTVSMFGGRGNSFVYQMPIALHFLIGACEFWTRINPQISGIVKKLTDYVKANRNIIIINKQKIEIYLFIYSIIGIFIGTSTFFQAILIFQGLALKSKTNPNMQSAQYLVKTSYHQKFINNGSIPGPLRKVFEGLWKIYEKLMNVF